jgi:ATP-dependent protease ClpP protease subunit
MEPVLHFNSEINENSIERLITRLRSSNAPSKVLIDSPGGTFNFFSLQAPAISRLGITTIANRVYSAASILFVLGAERVVHCNSELLFHEVRIITPSGNHITLSDVGEYEAMLKETVKDVSFENFDEWYLQMKTAQEWLVRLISENTKCSRGIIRSLVNEDTVISGKEAYRYGIATKYAEIQLYNENEI